MKQPQTSNQTERPSSKFRKAIIKEKLLGRNFSQELHVKKDKSPSLGNLSGGTKYHRGRKYQENKTVDVDNQHAPDKIDLVKLINNNMENGNMKYVLKLMGIAEKAGYKKALEEEKEWLENNIGVGVDYKDMNKRLEEINKKIKK